MRVLILGATGGTGRIALRETLARGHDVTVLVRDRTHLPPGSEQATLRDGDARDAEAVASAVRNQDAVISVLGIGKSLKPEGLIAAAAPNIVQAMDRAGVRRLVFTSAFGIGESMRDVPLLPRIMMATLLRKIYADKNIGEEAVRRSALDWTIVYPTMLTDKPGTGRVRTGERLPLRGMPMVSRADVGAYLASQLDARDHIRKGVLITQTA